LLIYRNSPAGEPMPGLDERLALEKHRGLQAAASARKELHSVARLDDTARARTVRRAGAAHETTDGPYVEAKEWLVGFYVLACSSEAEALDRAASICDPSHAIEVRPVNWRWPP
jgi:hypothetical protein